LALLSTPIVAHMLGALARESHSLIELRREVGSPPQTTMRAHLRALTETGVVTRLRRNDFPGSLDYELTSVGRDLWAVALVLQGWLATAPDGPIQLGSVAAKSAIKALVDGWGTNMVRALAARSLSLTELNRVLPGISYPSLERRLGAMRLAGQLQRAPSLGRRTPYMVTKWLRRAIAPLAAAARWERANVAANTPPIARLDVEATFLLAVPLLRLPADLSGACRLAVDQAQAGRPASVLVTVEKGSIAACATKPQGNASAWVSGSGDAWLRAIIDQDTDKFEIGGDCRLARALLDDLHVACFA
jgi:DNA-binding HxlR family transcriptional regulator